jgi:hypothetical protein
MYSHDPLSFVMALEVLRRNDPTRRAHGRPRAPHRPLTHLSQGGRSRRTSGGE